MIFLQEPIMIPDIYNNLILQYGAVGLLIAGLGWIVKYLVTFNLKQLKTSIEENKRLVDDVREENRKLENEYREYLKSNNELLFSILTKNTDAFNKNTEAYHKFTELMEMYIKSRIRSNNSQNL